MSDCVCPGYTLIYKCTVNTGGRGQHTVWKGTAFTCSNTNNTILLPHDHPDSFMIRECSNGSIKANLINEGNGYYTSQLNITVRPEFIGETVECIHDDGANGTSVGNMTIMPYESG